MAGQERPRAASLPEMLLVVCLMAMFGGAAFQGLNGKAGAALAQSASDSTGPQRSAGPQSSAGTNSSPPKAQPGSQARSPSVAEKIAASRQLLDINTATAAQLKVLPGMGEAYAARVIAGRPYTAKNQLATRGILPKDEYERIREQIIAHRMK